MFRNMLRNTFRNTHELARNGHVHFTVASTVTKVIGGRLSSHCRWLRRK
jgi:hypothetical protein